MVSYELEIPLHHMAVSNPTELEYETNVLTNKQMKCTSKA